MFPVRGAVRFWILLGFGWLPGLAGLSLRLCVASECAAPGPLPLAIDVAPGDGCCSGCGDSPALPRDCCWNWEGDPGEAAPGTATAKSRGPGLPWGRQGPSDPGNEEEAGAPCSARAPPTGPHWDPLRQLGVRRL
jgi:hypothetical protein